MVSPDFSLEILDAFDRRRRDEIVGQEYFKAHDHGSVGAAHFGAGHRGARAGDDLQLAGEERHERLRRAFDIDDIDVEAVLLENAGVFGDPKNRRRAGVGRDVSEVETVLGAEN